MKNSENRVRDLLKHYTKKELFDAFLVDLLFFVLSAGTIIIIFVNIVFMMVRFFTPLYILLYAILVLLTYHAKKYFIETLKNKRDIQTLDYKQIKYILVIIYSIVIILIQVIIFNFIT